MMKKLTYILLALLPLLLLMAGCHKDFLDKKPDKALLVPQTLDDIQTILDNTFVMNVAPGIQSVGDDDFYTTDNVLNTFSYPYLKNAYLWKADVYEGSTVLSDWSAPYKQILYANVALEKLAEMENNVKDGERWRNLNGAALFYRALGHYLLVQVFAPAYHEATAGLELGLPLRLNSDIDAKVARSSLSETYEAILKDAHEAMDLLPEQSKLKNRPSKQALYALLARIYLSMRDYQDAEDFADRGLTIDSALMDYNSLDASINIPMPTLFQGGNAEVIYYYSLLSNSYLSSSLTSVVPELYRQYADADLRKAMFFKSLDDDVHPFKGSYNGLSAINGLLFGGFANDELLLIKAECLARRKKAAEAITLVNRLRKYRFVNGSASADVYITATEETALELVLSERRKELVGRGLRWFDLKRLNQEEPRKKILERTYDGTVYRLEPNSPRYVFPIPPEEIAGSGIQQNER